MYPDLVVLTLWELQAPLHDNSGYFIRTHNCMYLVIFAFEFYWYLVVLGDQEQSICEMQCSLATLDCRVKLNCVQLTIVPMHHANI